MKAVALCVGGVPEWRHLIQFLPTEYHDPADTVLDTILDTVLASSEYHDRAAGKKPSVDKPCYTLH